MTDADEADVRVLVSVLFLCLSWEARQQVKRMLDDRQVALLTRLLEGEPNW